MAAQTRKLLTGLHVMCGLLIVAACYANIRLEVSAQWMEEGDPKWHAMTDVTANLMLGSWGLLVLTAIIVAVKRIFPVCEGLKRLVYALLAPPFYFYVARVFVAEWYFTFVSAETRSAFFS